MAGPEGASAREQMDAIYRWQVGIYDLTRRYYLFGRDRLIEGLAVPAGGTVVEVGCGTGRNLIVAAQLYRQAHFFGFDVSSVMIDKAKAAVSAAGLSDRITLALGDASTFEPSLFGRDGFDRVFCSYTLSMIPPWRGSVACAARAVAPGGSLHIVDFGQQEGLPAAFKAILFAWLARFHVEPRADMEAELTALAGSEGMALAFERLYRGYADYAVLRRA